MSHLAQTLTSRVSCNKWHTTVAATLPHQRPTYLGMTYRQLFSGVALVRGTHMVAYIAVPSGLKVAGESSGWRSRWGEKPVSPLLGSTSLWETQQQQQQRMCRFERKAEGVSTLPRLQQYSNALCAGFPGMLPVCHPSQEGKESRTARTGTMITSPHKHG